MGGLTQLIQSRLVIFQTSLVWGLITANWKSIGGRRRTWGPPPVCVTSCRQGLMAATQTTPAPRCDRWQAYEAQLQFPPLPKCTLTAPPCPILMGSEGATGFTSADHLLEIASWCLQHLRWPTGR